MNLARKDDDRNITLVKVLLRSCSAAEFLDPSLELLVTPKFLKTLKASLISG